MHESLKRLLDLAKEATASTRDPIISPGQLAARMGVSSATMTNWKARGVSKQGALEGEALFGCSAQWVLTGQGSPYVASGGPPPTYAANVHGLGAPRDLGDVLREVAELVSSADDVVRPAIAELLAKVASSPTDAESIGHTITALLQARRKRAG